MKRFFAAAVLGCAALFVSATNSSATLIIDWSTVSLSGSFPTFTFNNATLGDVTLSYSNDSEWYGISNPFPVSTLVLGNTGGESLIMSWTNPVNSLTMDIWDIDTASSAFGGESVTFTTNADVSVAYLNPTDVWTAGTKTLSNDGTVNDNNGAGNYSTLLFSKDVGFDSIRFDWNIDGTSTGILGVGQVNVPSNTVPEPMTMALFGTGLLGALARKRKR